MFFWKRSNKKWEVTIIAIDEKGNKIYKVTRRFPEMLVAETKVFRTKKAAIAKFNEWLE
jgi:hypothetical protein